MERKSDDLIPTRRSLLSRLKNWDDSESWRQFFNTYWKLIYGVAIKSGLSHAEAEDVVQETVVGVAKRISQFCYDPAVCSFKGWLLTVTRNRIATQFRKRRRSAGEEPADTPSGHAPQVEQVPDVAGHQLESIWEEEWQNHLLETALGRVKRKVPIEQYQIFDFYVLKKWPVTRVAKTLNVTIGHVYVAKHRISRLIRKEIELLEKSCRN